MFVIKLFNRIYMDIFGFVIKIFKGYKYILLVVDFFLKWFEVFFLKIQEFKEIVIVFFCKIFVCYGVFCIFIIDRG